MYAGRRGEDAGGLSIPSQGMLGQNIWANLAGKYVTFCTFSQDAEGCWEDASKQASKRASKQASKQASTQASKQASKHASKQTNKQTNKQAIKKPIKTERKQSINYTTHSLP